MIFLSFYDGIARRTSSPPDMHAEAEPCPRYRTMSRGGEKPTPEMVHIHRTISCKVRNSCKRRIAFIPRGSPYIWSFGEFKKKKKSLWIEAMISKDILEGQ